MPRQQQDQDQPGRPPGQEMVPAIPAPGFRPPPPPPPGPHNRDHPQGMTAGPPPGGASGSASSGGESPRTPTSPLPLNKPKAKAYEAIARGLLRAIGGLINHYVQATPDDDSFIPDDDDDETIPPPVGRLAARRIPIGDGENLSDLEDIGMAAVGLLAWAMKGATGVIRARLDKRRQKTPPGTVRYDGDEIQGAEAAP